MQIQTELNPIQFTYKVIKNTLSIFCKMLSLAK